ncbi:hypothetical protein GCM10010967_23070 [Dyadobacter beijingensis]|uniref:Uncharacterized protein n=1 Tax=Dyadobacter beijingensis TaxID=365489 RepID=A0ABQ2HTW4_9BACT|nr:hypothetical protein GCM10010967_23070 [Dyadobacter beijingensis]
MYHELFAYLASQKRDPFRQHLYWECDDVENGRCDWLEIAALDTLAGAQSWQTPVNVPVKGWRNAFTPAVVTDSISNAFDFPRRSGAVRATYAANRFELTTSRVGKVRLYLSPEMVDFGRELTVVINGQNVFRGRATMDKAFTLANYRREADRQAVWVNYLELAIPARR